MNFYAFLRDAFLAAQAVFWTVIVVIALLRSHQRRLQREPLPVLIGEELIRAVSCVPCSLSRRAGCTCTAWCGRAPCTGRRAVWRQPPETPGAPASGKAPRLRHLKQRGRTQL